MIVAQDKFSPIFDLKFGIRACTRTKAKRSISARTHVHVTVHAQMGVVLVLMKHVAVLMLTTILTS